MSEEGGPAQRTRQRKVSGLNNVSTLNSNMASKAESLTIEEVLNKQDSVNASSLFEQEDYAKEVLHNPSTLSSVKETELMDQSRKKPIRSNVGEIINKIELLSPANSPSNKIYLSGSNINKANAPKEFSKVDTEISFSTPRKKLITTTEMDTRAINDTTNHAENSLAGHESLTTLQHVLHDVSGTGAEWSTAPFTHSQSSLSSSVASLSQTSTSSVMSDWEKREENFNYGGQLSKTLPIPRHEISDSDQESEDGSQAGVQNEEGTIDDNQASAANITVLEKTGSQSEKDEEEIIARYKQRLQDNDQTVIFELFELMLTKMSQVQNKLTQIEDRIDSVEDGFGSSVEQIWSKSNKMEGRQKLMTESVEDALRIGIKAEQHTNLLSLKVDRLEARTLRGSLVLRGIPEKENEVCKEVVAKFLKNEMQIENPPEVQTENRFGKGKFKAISFRLADPSEVGIIFKHVSNLKDKRNVNDKPYSIDKQLT